MKKLLTFIGVIIFLLSFSSNLEAKGKIKPRKKETKLVKIKGDIGWINTGIRVRPNDVVRIKASGKVYFNNEGQSGVGPMGWPVKTYASSWPYNWNYCNDPERNMNHAALIGNVGNENFFVGRRLTFSGKSGVLYLGINDCTLTGDYKNSGRFIATITIFRNAIKKKKHK